MFYAKFIQKCSLLLGVFFADLVICIIIFSFLLGGVQCLETLIAKHRSDAHVLDFRKLFLFELSVVFFFYNS